MKQNINQLKEDKERELSEVLEKIKLLKIEERSKRKQIRKLANKAAPGETANKAPGTSHRTVPVDRYGERLQKGQKVVLLTKGKFHSNTGVIKKINDNTVVVKISNNKETWRNHNNIQIIKNEQTRKR